MLLITDEDQNLNPDTPKTLRMLFNINSDNNVEEILCGRADFWALSGFEWVV